MNDLMSLVGSSLVSLSFKGSVVILLVLTAQRFGRSWFNARSRYWLWIPALLSLLVPVGFEFGWSPFGRVGTPLISSVVAVHDTYATAHPMTPKIAFTTLWLFCAVTLFGVVLYNVFRYQRIRNRAHHIDAPAAALFRQCAHELRVCGSVRAMESLEIDSPVVIGFLRPIVLLPSGLNSRLDANQLRHVFLHELAHVKRNDLAVNWLITVAQVVHWFNPVVWYGLHRMRRDQEIACDALVLQHLHPSQRPRYGYTLISLMDLCPSTIGFSQGLRIVGSTQQIKERLRMISRFRTFPKRQAALLAVCLAGLAVFGLSENRTEAQSDRTKTEQVTVTGQPVLFTVVKTTDDTSQEVLLNGANMDSNSSQKVVLTVTSGETEDTEDIELTVVTTDSAHLEE